MNADEINAIVAKLHEVIDILTEGVDMDIIEFNETPAGRAVSSISDVIETIETLLGIPKDWDE